MQSWCCLVTITHSWTRTALFCLALGLHHNIHIMHLASQLNTNILKYSLYVYAGNVILHKHNLWSTRLNYWLHFIFIYSQCVSINKDRSGAHNSTRVCTVSCFICAVLMPFHAPRGNHQLSPLTDLIWFCQMCLLAPSRPSELPIFLLLLLIMFDSVNKWRKMRGRGMKTKGRLEMVVWVCERAHRVYRCGLCEKDNFILLGNSCWWQNFLSLPLSPLTFFLNFVLSIDFIRVCSAKSLLRLVNLLIHRL